MLRLEKQTEPHACQIDNHGFTIDFHPLVLYNLSALDSILNNKSLPFINYNSPVFVSLSKLVQLNQQHKKTRCWSPLFMKYINVCKYYIYVVYPHVSFELFFMVQNQTDRLSVTCTCADMVYQGKYCYLLFYVLYFFFYMIT